MPRVRMAGIWNYVSGSSVWETAAQRMVPAAAKAAGIRVAAICDRVPEMRDPIAERYGARSVSDIETLLAMDDIDAIYIATPTEMHLDHVLAALKAGKHVLCEKPMATTLAEATTMIEAADRAGVVFNVGHSHSYDEPNRAMREIIASGELGRARLLHNIHYTDWVYRPRLPEELDVNSGGGVTFRQGAHQFDILRLLGGGLVKSVRGQTFDWDPQRPVIGAHTVFLTFEDGAVATAIYNGYGAFLSSEMTFDAGAVGYPQKDGPGVMRHEMKSATAASEAKLKRSRAGIPAQEELPPNQPFFGWTMVSCEGGDIRQSQTGLYIYTERGREERPLRMDLTTRDPVIEEFVETVAGRRRALHDGRWARANLEICAATVESSRTGKEVTLKYQVAVPTK